LSYTRARSIEAVRGAVRRHLMLLEAMLPRMILVETATSAVSLVLAPAATPAPTTPAGLCTLPPGQSKLPAGVLSGLVHHLGRYPDLAHASPALRLAAVRLLDRARSATIALALTCDVRLRAVSTRTSRSVRR